MNAESISDVCAVTHNVAELIHVGAVNPISLMTSDLSSSQIHCIDLWDFFPRNITAFKPRVHVAGENR